MESSDKKNPAPVETINAGIVAAPGTIPVIKEDIYKDLAPIPDSTKVNQLPLPDTTQPPVKQDPVPSSQYSPAQERIPLPEHEAMPRSVEAKPKTNYLPFILLFLLLLVIGIYFFMKKKKTVSPMVAFGKKLKKITKIN